MDRETLARKLEEIKTQLGKSYPAVISSPAEITCNDHLSNFLRNGPARKIFLFNCSGGDHDYDELMTTEMETALEVNNDAMYAAVAEMIVKYFGTPIQAYGQLPADMAATDYDDITGEGGISYGIDWTPEYEGGAVFNNADSSTILYWSTSNEYIVLQKGKWSGDGNFLLFTLVTITPSIA
ncbi:hypothetical protein [Ferruginibacter sp.]